MSMAENVALGGDWGILHFDDNRVSRKRRSKRSSEVKKLYKLIESRQDDNGFMCMLSLRLLRLNDDETMTLWEKCADKDMEKFDRTLAVLISSDEFSLQDVIDNLNARQPISFVDQKISNLSGLPAYEVEEDQKVLVKKM